MPEIIAIAVLILFNGLFSAGEMAIVSSRKSRIKEMLKGSQEKRAEILLQMKENPERFLSAVQVGITLFGPLASTLGGIFAVTRIKPLFARLPWVEPFAEPLSVAIMVVLITYVSLVIGELVPKYIGINYREKAAVRIVPVIDITARLFSFVINFLSFSTMFLVKGLNLKQRDEHMTEDEIKILLKEARRKGVFDKTEEELIHGVFDFSQRMAKEIMVPKPDIYAISANDDRDSVLRYIIENEFSRYPVYEDHIDNIIGIVYQKDITRQIWTKQPFVLRKLMRKAFFVPDTIEISKLLKQMQKRRLHMAVAVDEYGTVVGILTLEDIIEEIFGEIMDETDVDDRVERLKDGSLVVDSSYSIRDVNDDLRLNLDESPDYETLGGFVLDRLQVIPKGGETVYHGNHKFTVVDIDGLRIRKIRIERIRTTPQKKSP